MTEIVLLLFKKYFNVICRGVLQLEGKKNHNSDQLSDCMKDMGGSQGGRASSPCPTPSHTSLSLSTSSASSVLKQKISISGNHSKHPSFLFSDREQLKEFLCPLPAKLPLFMPNAKILLQSPEADPTSPIPDAVPSAIHPISVLDKLYPVPGALKPCHLKLPSIML